jgi:hypothetical protein
MPVAVRPFQRRDRDQLTALVNQHVAAVIPGVVLSVNAVLGQLEHEPYENVVDPWVAERRCLVATREDGLVAAALLHRFRADAEVKPDYRGSGEIRWLVCKVDAVDDGRRLIEASLAQMREWGVSAVGADCSFPALGCYGIPDTLPHIRGLLRDAGFGEPKRTELVLAAECASLRTEPDPALRITRTLGLLGPRLTLQRDGDELGFIEIGNDHSLELARSSTAARWADVGNVAVADENGWVLAQLFSAAAAWLALGGVTRLMEYWAQDEDPPRYLHQLEQLGFQRLVVNERGMRTTIDPQ